LPIRRSVAQWLADKKLNEDAGVMAANREQSCSNSCDSAEEKLITLAERLAGGGGMLPLDPMESPLIW
jgi:hypothetical protein